MYISVRECIVTLLRFKGAYRLNFELNGIQWQIVWVDNKSSLLSRTDGSMSVGVTDMNTHCIYLAKSLHGAFLRKVITHELCHCVCMSYDKNGDQWGSVTVGKPTAWKNQIWTKEQLEQHKAGRQSDGSWNYPTLFDLTEREAIKEYNRMWDQIANWP